ncbi:hypothetical protein J6590_096727 [Homalodisca vitripennis]|nr:hypothetical protein J6590_096727 [Homalodisca vitripennis]
MYFIVSTLINLWVVLNVGQTDTVGLEDLISVDRDLETTLRTQIDFFYPAIVCFVTIQLSPYLRFITETKSAYFITVVMTKFSSVQAVLMKHMVLKRMKCIQEKVVGTRNILDLVPLTRRILGFNHKVNSVLSLFVVNAISTGLLQFLASILLESLRPPQHASVLRVYISCVDRDTPNSHYHRSAVLSWNLEEDIKLGGIVIVGDQQGNLLCRTPIGVQEESRWFYYLNDDDFHSVHDVICRNEWQQSDNGIIRD